MRTSMVRVMSAAPDGLLLEIGGKPCPDDLALIIEEQARQLRAADAENVRLRERIDKIRREIQHAEEPDLPPHRRRRRRLLRIRQKFVDRLFNPGPWIYAATLLIALWHLVWR